MTRNQLGCAEAVGAEKWDLLCWSERPHIYWVDRDWPRYRALMEWLDLHNLPCYQSTVSGYDEFIVESDTLRVELRLRFS